MSDSQSHQMDQQVIIYEEEQVLWAKIRGYPWWPAFVDKVHGANSQQEIQYTVFFFGDNTHSRLGGSKLRRFIDFYTQFFPKAKTNRKLYLSIMKAQQKLKQNDANVQIFEKLRNALKKPKKSKGNHRTQSKIGSQQPQIQQNQHMDIPQLGRNKTFPFKQQMKQQKQQQLQKQSFDQKIPKRRGRKPKKQAKQQSQKQQQQQKNQQQQQNIKQNNEVQQQFQQTPIQQQNKTGYRTRLRRISRRQQKQKIIIQAQKQQIQQSQQKDQQQQQSPNEGKYQRQYPLRVKTKPIYRNIPKKRGRPKKVQQIQNSLQQSSQQNNQNSQMQNQNQQIEEKSKQIKQRQRPTGQNRKSRLQRTIKNVQISKNGFKQLNNQKLQILQKQQQKQKQHPQKQLILQRIKFCLNKREQLIQYLDQLNVTTNIIQQILNLDVTTIILQGEITQDSIRVLQKLRSAILHKYFPDDIKIRKKYEKTSKKTTSRTTKAQQQQTLQDLQLRRKTIIKLQKILRNVDSTIDQKQKAIQIQSYFRKSDQQIGNGYKTIAYKVLRSLKDKLQSLDQVLLKLQNGQFEEQDK